MLGPGRAQSHYVRGLDGPRGPFCTDASVPTAVTEGIGLSVTAVFMPPLYRAGRLVATSNEPPEVRDHESLSALSLHPRLPADDARHDARDAWAPLGQRPRSGSRRRAWYAAPGSEPDFAHRRACQAQTATCGTGCRDRH